jgi:hypothetical protein
MLLLLHGERLASFHCMISNRVKPKPKGKKHDNGFFQKGRKNDEDAVEVHVRKKRQLPWFHGSVYLRVESVSFSFLAYFLEPPVDPLLFSSIRFDSIRFAMVSITSIHGIDQAK